MSQDSSRLFSLGITDEDSGVDPQIKSREQNMSDIESINRIDMGSKQLGSILFTEMGLDLGVWVFLGEVDDRTVMFNFYLLFEVFLRTGVLQIEDTLWLVHLEFALDILARYTHMRCFHFEQHQTNTITITIQTGDESQEI